MERKTELKQVAIELYDVGAIKYGDFVTKVGLKTPIYIDLRVIISYPRLLVRISKLLWSLLEDSNYTHICGVPYTALPIATVISAEINVPMVIRRKEVKSYGMKKMIEGYFTQGDIAVIVEDIITSGSSVIETAKDLTKEGLKVSTALVIVDREQGGKKNLENSGIQVKSLFKITDLIQYLREAGRLTEESVKVVTEYIKNVQAPSVKIPKNERLMQDFKTRAKSSKNPVAARVLSLMSDKQTTICLAADFTSVQQVLDIADLAGPHIAALKIHVDILSDFDKTFVSKLKALSIKHNFLIMEDRKFADIGHVVSQQFRDGSFAIAEWADLVTIHAIPGAGIIDGIRSGLAGIEESKGVFIVAEMSSKGALTTGDYVSSAIALAKDNDLVAGFVCQKNVFEDPGMIQLTPGVKLVKSGDDLGQQYNTPAEVVENGADLVVVGRGITEAEDKIKAVLQYKKVLFDAYESRVKCE